MEKPIKTDTNAHFAKVMSRFTSFRTSKQHCDFAIKVRSEKIAAHKGVLAAGSDYFDAMLSHDTLERRTGLVEIKDADVECVKKCIDYIYTGKISISDKKHWQLMHVARIFQLEELCDAIVAFLQENLDPKSFFVTKNLAHMYDCKKLEQKCDQFALENLREIVEEKEFTQLCEDYMSFLLKSKSSKATEGLKCEALIRWVKHDTARQNLFFDMVKMLDLSKIQAENLGYLLKSERLILKDEKCHGVFVDCLLKSMNVKPKSSRACEIVTKIMACDKIIKSLQCFDEKTKTWHKMHPLHKEMSNLSFSIVPLEKYLYAFLSNKAVYRLLHSDTNATWERMADMLERHGGWPSVTVLSGCMYVIGSSAIVSKLVEKYDPSRNKWEKVADRLISCGNSTSVALGDHIYSIGGHDGTYYLDTVERFNPQDQRWAHVASLKHCRSYPGVATLRGKIYVAGGHDADRAVSSVECFNPSTNVWTVLAPMLNGRCLPTALVVDDLIYVVSGESDGAINLKSIEAFDTEKNQWEMIAKWQDAFILHRSAVAVELRNEQ